LEKSAFDRQIKPTHSPNDANKTKREISKICFQGHSIKVQAPQHKIAISDGFNIHTQSNMI
jgi:hypothetical protein